MKALFSFLFTLIFCTVNAQSLPQWMQGNWAGNGLQIDVSSVWSVSLTVAGGDALPGIYYPSLGCAGYWKLLSIEKEAAVFEETITSDTYACANHERVRVSRRSSGQILLEFSHAWEPKKMNATAILNRK